mgnify:CR=1 FL=1
MKNDGIRNEYLFIQEINGKKYTELSFLIQEMILVLFPRIKPNNYIKCFKNIDYEKGDIVIQVGYDKKYVSIKKGHRNSIHCESIKKFISFLKKLKISPTVINEILKYQYADGTTNGTGNSRVSSAEYKENNKESIELINKTLNDSKIIQEVVNRFIIQGTQNHSKKIDLLIYGTPNDFFFITPEEIYSYIKSKQNIESSAIHFSCLTLQPLSRVLNYNEKLEYMRHWIQIKWYNLEDNIFEILNERFQNNLNN